MSISDKIDNALNEVLNEAIKDKKVSKILAILTNEILKLCEKNLSVKEQCEVINKAFKLDIKESAYSAFYYRKIKPLLSKETVVQTPPIVESKTSTQKKKKTVANTATRTTQKTVEKTTAPVAPEEPTNKKSVKEIFKQTITHKSDLEDYL